MSREFVVPELGEGVDSAEVIDVPVSPGDHLSDGDGVIEVESDKAAAEVPFEGTGVVEEIRVSVGDTVAPGDVVLTYTADESAEASGDETEDDSSRPSSETERDRDETPAASRKGSAEEGGAGSDEAEHASNEPEDDSASEEDESDASESESTPADEEDEAPDAAKAVGAVMATPSVRRLAREIGIDIHAVEGSGPHGRILDRDVKKTARAVIRTCDGSRERISPVLEDAPDFDEYGPVRRERMNGVRRVTARRMAEIWTTSPRVTNFDTADVTAVEDARRRLRERRDEVGLTAVLLSVTAGVLRDHPKLNATVDMDREQIVFHRYVHMSVAVDTPRGLLAPVVRDADRKHAVEIHEELRELASAARDGKLSRDRMRGGTFSISNLGGLGGGWFTPVVNLPEAAVLGVGEIRTEPVWADGGFEPRRVCPLSLSYDHRLVDGADAARFLGALRDALENPLLTLIQGDRS